jgi:hypothetical protein
MCAADVQSRAIRWGWDGRDPIGYLAVQTGVEGIGKGVFAAWRIAQYSRGELPGEWRGQPVTTLVVAGEDGIADIWKPRLALADADLTRVQFLKLNGEHVPIGWNVRDGIDVLEAAIQKTAAQVVFFDAILDHLPAPGAGESVNSPTWVRRALAPLKQLARSLDIVATYSMHPPKAKSADFRDLVQLSQAFSAVPRVGMLYAYHPQDEPDDPDRRRVLIRGKGNIGRDPGALEFRIAARPYRHDDGRTTEREVVVGVSRSDVSMADLTRRPMFGEREPTKTEQAAEAIRAALADGEWHLAKPILDALAARGLAHSNVGGAARRTLGVECRKRPGERNGPWEWRLESYPEADRGSLGVLDPLARAETIPAGDSSLPPPLSASNNGKNPRIPALEPSEVPAGEESNNPSPGGLRAHARGAAAGAIDWRSRSSSAEAAKAVDCRYQEAHAAHHLRHPDAGRRVCVVCHPPAFVLRGAAG